MKQYILALMLMLLLAGNLYAQQAAQNQSSTPAQPGGATAGKQKAESECMTWAKQQAGLEKSGSSQPSQPSSTDKQGAATPDKNAGTTPPDKNAQSNTAAGLADTAAQMAGSAAGGATSKVSDMVKEAYS